MLYEIRTYGDDVLREDASPVAEVTDGIRQLAKDMLETMYVKSGAGLAAEQIGRNEAVCVIDVSFADREREKEGQPPENPDVPMPLVLINPEITASEGEQSGPEGCLSFPEIFVKVPRAAGVTVAFTDLNGDRQEVRARGLLARAIQHELDHLRGVLLVDRMSHVQKVAVFGKLKRLKKAKTTFRG